MRKPPSRHLRLLALALIVVATAGCGKCNEPQNPVSPEYPCGTRGHKCSSGMCCWNGEDCGGDVPWCPAGVCCYAGSGAAKDAGAASDAGPAPHEQYSPAEN